MNGGGGPWVFNLPARHHAVSEDSAFVGAGQGGWWAAVADGVGSAPGGREASEAAVAEVARGAEAAVPGREALLDVCRGAARRLSAVEGAQPQLRGLATTLAVLGCGPDGLWVAHLGDSRVYGARRDGVRVLTADHRVASGPQSFLTRAVTARGEHTPDVRPLPGAEAGDLFLLCTDGVWSAAGPGALERALAAGPGTARAFLGDLADRRRDDFCYVLLEVAVAQPSRRSATRPLAGEGLRRTADG